jgi:tetratricopeptide (TPR) repeat protein
MEFSVDDFHRSSAFKEEGNDQYRKGNYDDAKAKYNDGMNLLTNRKDEESKELLGNLLLNRGACNLKLNDYTSCIDDCTLALTHANPVLRVKALFRRATAFWQLGKLSESRADLQTILGLDKSNNEALHLMKIVAEAIERKKPQDNVQRLIERIKEEIEKKVEGEKGIVDAIRCLIDLCSEDSYHSRQFGKFSGLILLVDLISDPVYSNDLRVVCVRLLAVLTNHSIFCRQFITLDAYHENNSNSVVQEDFLNSEEIVLSVSSDKEGSSLPFLSVFALLKLSLVETEKTIIMIIMNILRSFPVFKDHTDSNTMVPTEEQLFLPSFYGKMIIFSFKKLLKSSSSSVRSEENFTFLIEAFNAFLSDLPNYYDQVKPVDSRLESLEDRNKRLTITRSLKYRSHIHASWAIFECDMIPLLIDLLDNDSDSTSFLFKQGASSALAKLIKYYDENGNYERIKKYFTKLFSRITIQSSSDSSEGKESLLEHLPENIPFWRKRALLEGSLLLSHPELGSWLLEQHNGIQQLILLIQTQDIKLTKISSEVLCLASGADSSVALLKPVVELGILESLIHYNDNEIKSNAASALTKLAIKSKALTSDSPENSEILNTVHSILKNSSSSWSDLKDNNNHSKQLQSSTERCIEVLSALVGKSYVKEEIVHGSSRVKSCIAELINLSIPEGSSALFAIAHIFAALTVTNRELKALALAEKEMTVEQYEQLAELNRIKTKGENGEVIEEKKVKLLLLHVLDVLKKMIFLVGGS